MYIEEIREQTVNTVVEGLFALTNIEMIRFKQKEGEFLTCTLSDKTGKIRAIIWEDADKERKRLYEKMVVKVKGEATRYADKPQMVIISIEEVKEYDRSHLMKALPKEERIRVRKQFSKIHQTIKDETFKKIWDAVANMKAFWHCPGGKGDVHHEYLCGLAEHTIRMMFDSKPYIRQYNLDAELLLTGILVHDLGKIHSYTWDVVIDMTAEGRLLGHPEIGVQVLVDLLKESPASIFSNIKLLKLIHMVLSHHGEHSPIKPQIKEAIILSCLDGANAAIKRVEMLEEEVVDGDWTRYDRSKERFYYIHKKQNTVTTKVPESDNFTFEDEDDEEEAL